jgi:hypothetical protein
MFQALAAYGLIVVAVLGILELLERKYRVK